MRPYKNFLFLLALICVLFAITVFLPNKFSIASYEVVLPDSSYINIFNSNRKPILLVEDSIAKENERIAKKILENNKDTSFLFTSELAFIKAYPIEFSNINPNSFDDFFYELSNIKESNNSLRISHYGDSQIEGDRITSSFRNLMQRAFGGSGLGLLPLFSPVNASSFLVNKNNSFKQTTIINSNTFHEFGMTMGNITTLNKDEEPSIKIEPSPFAPYPDNVKFTRVKILSKDNLWPNDIKFLSKNITINTPYSVNQKTKTKIITYYFSDSIKKVNIVFSPLQQQTIYGISLEDSVGISVDNISLRGCAGFIFTPADSIILSETFTLMGTKLVILQFGINCVPAKGVVSDEYAAQYESNLYKELLRLKSSNPNICVLVVGVSDRSIKVNQEFKTNPSVPIIRDAQRRATMRAGYAFWDLYQAMGGNNSMQEWANAKPSLAGKDFTHFSIKGAEKVGEMMYKSLMLSFLEYKQRKEKEALTLTSQKK